LHTQLHFIQISSESFNMRNWKNCWKFVSVMTRALYSRTSWLLANALLLPTLSRTVSKRILRGRPRPPFGLSGTFSLLLPLLLGLGQEDAVEEKAVAAAPRSHLPHEYHRILSFHSVRGHGIGGQTWMWTLRSTGISYSVSRVLLSQDKRLECICSSYSCR
jgi:hypothetical protein